MAVKEPVFSISGNIVCFDVMYQDIGTVKLVFARIKIWAEARVWDAINGFASLPGQIRTKFQTAYDNAKIPFANIKTWATERLGDIQSGFSGVGSWFTTNFDTAYDNLTGAFDDIGTWAGGLWTTVKLKFVEFGTAVGTAIGGSIKDAINGALSKVESVINGAIDKINGMVKVYNDLLPGTWNDVGTLEHVTLPRMMATGGVVNKATSAIIGESGKEAVMPLERNTGWIDKLADRIASRQGGGGDIYLTVQTTLDGRVIAEEVTKVQRRDARRTNKPVWGNA